MNIKSNQLYGLFVLLVGLLGFALGMAFTYQSISIFQAANESLTWVETQAYIHESKLGQYDAGRYSDIYPIIRYSYAVNDTIYNSERILCKGNVNEIQAKEKVAKYQQGATVAAFYNPQNPEMVCLEPGVVERSTYFMLIGGGCFLILSLFLVRYGISNLREKD